MTALAELIDSHRGAFEYDWRTRFHLPLSVVGTRRMTWGEAMRQTRILRSDPSSAISAALEGWKYGITREALILLDLFDLEHRVNAKKPPKSHPMRPGGDRKPTEKAGNRAGRSNAQVLALVRPSDRSTDVTSA